VSPRTSKLMLAVVGGLLLAGCGPKGEELYARAAEALENGDARAAVIDLKNLVESEPQNARARALLARALLATYERSAAEIELQKAIDLGAPESVTLLTACQLRAVKNEFEQVLEQCRPEAGAPEDEAELMIVQGTALLGLDRAADARQLFQAARAKAPGSLEAALGEAMAVRTVDGTGAAVKYLEGLSGELGQHPRYWVSLASLRSGAGDDAGAEQAYQASLAQLDKRNDVRYRLLTLGGLVETQLRLGKLEAADTTSARLFELAPRNAYAMKLRGQVLAATGKVDDARGLFEKVVGDDPGDYDARLMLGLVNAQQGNLDQAEANFAAVVSNQPQNTRAHRLLAELRTRLGNPEATLSELRSALNQTGNDPGMLAMAGRLSLQSGDRGQGLAYLAAARQGEQVDTTTRLQVANGYLVAGELDLALETLQSIESTGDEDPLARQRDAMLLLTLLRKRDEEGLDKQAKELLARSGSDPQVRNIVGSVYAAAGRAVQAREQFEAAAKLDPKDIQSQMNLARLDLAAGQPDAARGHLERILALDPQNLGATLGLALAASLNKDAAASEKHLRKAVTDHPESVSAQLALAQHYVGAGKNDAARASIEQAVSANARNPDFLAARGIVMLATRDAPAAVASFEQALALAPTRTDLSVNLARAHLANRDQKAALATLDGALKESPRDLSTLAFAASLSLATNELERAAGYVERVRQVAPDSTTTYQLEGDLAMAQKRYREALAAYEKADPSGRNRAVTLGRFTAAQRAGLPEADAVLERWITEHPDDVPAITSLAEYRHGRGDLAGAARAYESGLSRKAGDAILNNNLAVIYDLQGDKRALATARAAHEAAPQAPAIKDTYGWLLLRAGKTEEALPLLESVAAEMSDNAEVQYHYAAALAKAGRKSDALPVLKNALGGTLPPEARSDAETLLAELTR
jgi:putative PEP-CTERM system TPR-repeat lipoprotein